MTTNYIFVTGGVVSSLGKGIAAASLAAILEARGLNVTIMKLDPYTIRVLWANPTREVFVTEAAETDTGLSFPAFVRTGRPAAAATTGRICSAFAPRYPRRNHYRLFRTSRAIKERVLESEGHDVVLKNRRRYGR